MLVDILPKLSRQESWTEFIDDAKKFHKTATGALNRREVFSADILYNIFSMSIEKYFMGFSMYKKDLPYNHTFKDFADAAQRVTCVDQGLLDDLQYMDSFQEICSIDFYERNEPSEQDIIKIAQICNRVKSFVMGEMPEN
jgi:hypothetical protein